MEEASWVARVNEETESMMDIKSEIQHWQKGSIYKVPACVVDLNKKAYRPQSVSFGPYHHGEDHLIPMEEHKHRALLHFLRRAKKPLGSFVDSLAQVAQELKDSYVPLPSSWQENTSKFLQLMILDGCFMLEVMRTSTHLMDDYAPNDPIFSNHGKLYIMPYIKRDMLMIENQIPILVLDKLIATESDHAMDSEFVNKLIQKFCSPGSPVSRMGKCLHVLDVYRKTLLREGPHRSTRPGRSRRVDSEVGDEIIRSAAELKEAGIWFRKSKTTSLRDISFNRGVLRLPVIIVDDATESNLLNLVAFERFHVGAGNEVTSYVFFMDNMVDSERDVALLQSKGIIQNAIGSDKAVASLFNSISRDITLDPESSLDIVHKKVIYYCKKPWNKWRANLISTYFTNPWAILSLIAAILLFALTIVQTIFTVSQYYQNESPSPSPSPPPRAPAMIPPKLPRHL